MYVQSYFVDSMDLFRSEYGLQGAVGFISCQDPSSNFFRFIIAIIHCFHFTVQNFLKTFILQDFSLPARGSSGLRSSAMLCGAGSWLFADVSGHLVGPQTSVTHNKRGSRIMSFWSCFSVSISTLTDIKSLLHCDAVQFGTHLPN